MRFGDSTQGSGPLSGPLSSFEILSKAFPAPFRYFIGLLRLHEALTEALPVPPLGWGNGWIDRKGFFLFHIPLCISLALKRTQRYMHPFVHVTLWDRKDCLLFQLYYSFQSHQSDSRRKQDTITRFSLDLGEIWLPRCQILISKFFMQVSAKINESGNLFRNAEGLRNPF